MNHTLKTRLTLLLIIFVAAVFRFYNINWDSGHHLHPDERFLTIVGTAMKIPQSLGEYFNPQASTLNPANIGQKFYVYGTFPVVLNKIMATILGADSYNDLALQGRVLSGFFDLLIIVLVYKTLLLFEKKYKLASVTKYYGAFFYAIAVLPIQLSHFFTVDTFLNFFMFASFYKMLKFYLEGKMRNIIFSAIFLGLALASKITALFLLPLILTLLVFHFWKKKSQKNLSLSATNLFLFCFIFYISIRIFDPYLFQSGNFFDPRISSHFIQNLKILRDWFRPDAWYPPGVHWIGKTPLYPLSNTAIFGLGIPYAIFIILGIKTLITKPRRLVFLGIISWVFVFFTFQAAEFIKAMRYFIIFYPFFAIFAAVGFASVTKNRSLLLKTILIVIILIWPLSFLSIYTQKHSRITASEWIYQNIPDKSVILSESWDDGLPLSLSANYGKTYTPEYLPVFDQDTPEKWAKMYASLQKGDYYILSSARGRGSIGQVPQRYPLMSKFYSDLLTGKTDYKLIKEFSSYPSLRYLGIPIDFPDQMADEYFTVFDHPKVLIFKKAKT